MRNITSTRPLSLSLEATENRAPNFLTLWVGGAIMVSAVIYGWALIGLSFYAKAHPSVLADEVWSQPMAWVMVGPTLFLAGMVVSTFGLESAGRYYRAQSLKRVRNN